MAPLDSQYLMARLVRTVIGFWSLGGVTVQHEHFDEVSHPTVPEHPLGNFVHHIRHDADATLRALVGAEGTPPTAARRRVIIDDGAPAKLEALLTLHDWQLERQLQLVLPSTTHVGPPKSKLRPATTDADWEAISDLFRSDHLEEDARRGAVPRPPAQTEAAVALRRSMGPDVEYLLAEQDDSVIGCIGIWVSAEQVGLIEDVFVRAEARGAGVATNLLRHAVHNARRRGAREIIIGADIEDTPKHLYAKFGFEPAAILRSLEAPTPQDDRGGDASL
jgi:GNAT superfamily N-acetyltransferase